MYTYDLITWGLNPKNTPLLDSEWDWVLEEFEFRTKISGNKYSVETYYHGSADTKPMTIGWVFSDTDDEYGKWIKDIRNFDENLHKEDFEVFRKQLIFEFEQDVPIFEEELEIETQKESFRKWYLELKEWLENEIPEIYSVQCSS